MSQNQKPPSSSSSSSATPLLTKHNKQVIPNKHNARDNLDAQPDPEILLDTLSNAAGVNKRTSVYNQVVSEPLKTSKIGPNLAQRFGRNQNSQSDFSSSQTSSSFQSSFGSNYRSGKTSVPSTPMFSKSVSSKNESHHSTKENQARVVFADDSTKEQPKKDRGLLNYLNPSRSNKDAATSSGIGKTPRESSSEGESRKVITRSGKKVPSKSCLKESSASSSAATPDQQYDQYLNSLNERMSGNSGELQSSGGFRSSREFPSSSGRSATTYSSASSSSYQNYFCNSSVLTKVTNPIHARQVIPKMGTRGGSATTRNHDQESIWTNRRNDRRHSFERQISKGRPQDFGDGPSLGSRVPFRHPNSIITSSSGGPDSQHAMTSPHSSQSPSDDPHPLLTACKLGLNDQLSSLLNPSSNYDLENLVDDSGNNGLHYAAFSGHLEVIVTLINEGMTIELCNRAGETPIDLATRKDHNVVAEILKLAADYQRREADVATLKDRLQQINSDNTNLQTNLNSAYESLAVNKRNNATLEQLHMIKQDLADVIEKTRNCLTSVEVGCDQKLRQQMFETTTMLKSLGSRCQDVRTHTPTEQSLNPRNSNPVLPNGPSSNFSSSNSSEIFQQTKRQCLRNGMHNNNALDTVVTSPEHASHVRLRSKSLGGDRVRNSKIQRTHTEEYSTDEALQAGNEYQLSNSETSVRSSKSNHPPIISRNQRDSVTSLVVEDRTKPSIPTNQNRRPWYDGTEEEITLPTGQKRSTTIGNTGSYATKDDKLRHRNSGEVLFRV
ncbi:uncharacterized protein LOC142342876 isoform X1 [Convolutriloba macropyga]|uniref:uncharacterized protein LOC142342876 isoform X1 n=1 Tax=Convolutriloba macropyga TaxID=536237 RepID=UPI003F526CFA